MYCALRGDKAKLCTGSEEGSNCWYLVVLSQLVMICIGSVYGNTGWYLVVGVSIGRLVLDISWSVTGLYTKQVEICFGVTDLDSQQ